MHYLTWLAHSLSCFGHLKAKSSSGSSYLRKHLQGGLFRPLLALTNVGKKKPQRYRIRAKSILCPLTSLVLNLTTLTLLPFYRHTPVLQRFWLITMWIDINKAWNDQNRLPTFLMCSYSTANITVKKIAFTSPLPLNAASLTHCTLWLSCKPSYLCVRSANLPVSDTRLVTSAYQWLADRGAVDEVAHLVTLL